MQVVRPKILVADDEATLRFLVAETLDESQYELLEACDGKETLEKAQHTHPNLILLDVAMPGLSGIEVCQQLKTNPSTADIIIVMLTAHGQSKDRELATAAGADHFITKPFSPLQLTRLISQIL